MTETPQDTAIALIGMAGRFPGARTIDAYWQNIVQGVKSIRFFSDEELLRAGVDPDLLAQPNYVKAGAIVDDIDLFDASLFKYAPQEAALMDPQHRLFLECAWEALEDAGYDPERYQDLVGIFAGSAISTYLLRNILPNSQVMSDINSMQAALGNDKDSLASRVSYKLNLRGPSIAVQTYCSTSLVATHLACQSLLNYECDMALAGGVALSIPQLSGYLYEEGGILSPDGVCRTFDARGQGSVMGNGAGVVVLKRYAEAYADGDQIYAVLLSSCVNNDGSVRVSYTAPGLHGQTEVIAQAISDAGIETESIGYVEAHGTATMLGDSIELAAMHKAFARTTREKQFCAIGSVKPNIGHLDRASGVAGLIKAALALKHRVLPPSLDFTQASPDIDLEHSPFYVNTSARPWEVRDAPRRAGVSSFGIGGTNAHVVLQEAPHREPSRPVSPWQLFLLSAQTEQTLQQATHNLAAFLRTSPDINLADAAYTLQVGRGAFNHRRFVVGQQVQEVVAALEAGDHTLSSAYQVNRDRPVAFLFSGGAANLADLARDLYQTEPIFRQAYEQCSTHFAQLTGMHLTAELLAADEGVKLLYQEPLTFTAEYALAQLLQHRGVQPGAVLGYGPGAYVAACLAGVFSLDEALRLVASALPLQLNLPAPSRAEKLAELAALIGTFALHEPALPLLSPLTGTRISNEQATDPACWLEHRYQIAHVDGGLDSLLAQAEYVLLSTGQGHAAGEFLVALTPTLSAAREQPAPRAHLLAALGQLWLAGVTIEWQKLYQEEKRQRVSLPTYPFERKRYWIEAPYERSAPALRPAPAGRKEQVADWFYRPCWERVDVTPDVAGARAQNWLILPDATGVGERLAERLQQQGHSVVRVYPGTHFARPGEAVFQVRPGASDDYTRLCTALASEQHLPDRVWHGWNITRGVQAVSAETLRAQHEQGFLSLLYLARALSAHLFEAHLPLLVFSSSLQNVTGQEALQPEKAPLLGASKVISQEPLNITCRCIDIEQSEPTDELIEQVLRECMHQQAEQVVAYRAGQRWVQTYAATPLASAHPQTAHLRPEGVYLITGGLGGIGLALAEYLAKTVRARLVLVGRSPLPPRDTWQDVLQRQDADARLQRKISSVLQIEEQGGAVLLCQADIADEAQVQQVVQSAVEIFGTIHGVFHAAGVTDPATFKTVEQLTAEDCEIHFRPKVYGTYALKQALEGRDLDFCLLFSSLSAVLGGLGFCAYAAANAFLDAMAYHTQRETNQRWLSVNWDTWLVNEEGQTPAGATIAAFAMTASEGIEALLRVLASGEMHLVHSTGDLQARLLQWSRAQSPAQSAQPGAEQADALHQFAGEDYEQQITRVLQQALGLEHVGPYENFFDLGGNSLIALDVIARLKKIFRRPIPAVALFEAPTISTLAAYLRSPLAGTESGSDVLQQRRERARQAVKHDDLAIIGMTCRFPGAANVEQFWHNLSQGVESITTFSDEELLAAGVDPQLISSPDYVKARPVLDQVDQFDAHFFGYSPREAELTDPQHRLFLECAWEVLEQAGYDCHSYEGLIGVFGGSNISTYLLSLAASDNRARLQAIDGFQIVISNDKDSLTTTASYKLNLKGPSFAVQTFCSTSLVAVHLASQSLLRGECDMALAGGVSIRVPNRVGYLYIEGGQEAPDGHCRAFDERSQGSVLGDGVGIVVLKRLADALADGDTIHAVIKGSAINNDGSLKVSYSAPSVVGQASVVTQALQDTNIPAESIGYIEAHGTGTKLGDPIEIASLTRAFRARTEKVGFCSIGSLKTNVGHLDRAAGVAGLIKTALVLKHGQIPPTLHFHAPNPEIDFASSPFFVSTQLLPWPRGETPRRASVNSLGMGGTNAHVIMEEAPQAHPVSPAHPWQLLVWSARTETALLAATRNLQHYLQEHTEVNLTDVAYTLQRGRSAFEHRCALVCRDGAEAVALLAADNGQRLAGQQERRDRAVAFLFPGVGEQTAGMAAELYQTEAVFRETIDHCCALVQQFCGLDLYAVLYPAPAEEESVAQTGTHAWFGREKRVGKSAIRRTDLAQPAAFVLEYALARLFMQKGILPRALLGYSLGEYVAACLADVLSLEDALRLVTGRAQLIGELAEGSLLVVALSEEDVRPYLSEQVDLAVVNAPHTCTLGGPAEALSLVEKQLRACGVACSPAETAHAFHTRMLQPVRERFIELVRTVSLQAPRIPYVSNVTGTWITAEQATNPEYWADHMCCTVRFAHGVTRLLQDTDYAFLEVGPGQALSSFVRQNQACEKERFPRIITTLVHGYETRPDTANMLLALGKLWLAGVTPDWSALYQGERRQRLPLPTYPFERQSYWLLEKGSAGRRGLEQRPRVQIARKSDVADWFYRPVWTRASLSAEESRAFSGSPWLIFADELGVGEQIGAQVAQQGHRVIYIRPGAHFACLDEQNFTVSAAEPDDYIRLFTTLAEKDQIPQRVVHCWHISAPSSAPQVEQFRLHQEQGFYSMLSLAKGLSPHIYDEPVQIIAFATHMQEVTGQETLQPGKATLLGACKVISQEPLNLVCRCVDLAIPPDGWNVEELVAECSSGTTDLQVAYREDGRWRQEYEPVALPAVEAGDLPFRTQGVYLITGGLGAIGLTLAEYLARTWQARLVLLGRSGLPPAQQWEDWLATHDAHDPQSERIRRVQALEALGGQVLVYGADVSDEAQMHTLVQGVQATFGALHGVFHAAGIVDEKVFKAVQDIGREECEIHFQAKAYGTYALAEALRDVDLDFCLLFSSLSVVLGGLGFAAYAAANTFLDAFTRLHNRDGRLPWRSVNWDTWDVRANAHGSLGETIAAFAMRPDDCVDALTRILRCPHAQLVNSTGDLPARLSQWLRADLIVRSNAQREHVAAGVPGPGNYEQTIKEIWQDVLGVKEVGLYENFFELGGNSLIALEVINKLKKALRRPIPAVMLFEAPTISLLTKYLQPEQQPEPVVERDLLKKRREDARRVARAEGIAIIGMSGRFPGASSTAQFWQNLSGGVESISFFSPEELEAAGVDPQVYQAPNYVPARPVLAPEVVEQFDAAFFGYSPREAELTDPQHRVFLECAWEALEQAGYDTRTYEGLVGVFAGTNISTYIFRADTTKLGDVNQYQLLAGNDKDSLTSSVSYKLNLRGPSLAVQTFCSTSLVATHLACQSLLNGECDLALAGGASISVPSVSGHLYEPGGMESPDGHCHTFDAQARGSMFGDGVGIVALKRLEDAIADGDYIQAVIKGSAINNDGSQKVSYAAPSVAGQAEVVLAALANANVPAESLSYIEAHGTATELGDPIEVASLTRAFRASTDQVGFCPIGSVKTNVGHLDRAAGISGLIKVVLSLQQEQIPPSLHFHSPNPEIDFEHSPFFVNTQLRAWPRGATPRRAGVNSLGMGGTNAHIVVEEAPIREPSGPSRPWQLLLLSARSAPALAQVKQRLSDFLRQQTDESIADVAYTLQRGRQRLEYRAALVCRDRSEALRLLAEQPTQVDRAERRVDRPVAFLFPGVGEQYVGMAQELYQQEKEFRTVFDSCCDLLQKLLDIDLRPVVFPPAGSRQTQGEPQPGSLDLRALLGRQPQDAQAAQVGDLQNTSIAQPLMFVVEYALAQLLRHWGIQPRAMLGYSVGEYVAACLAGVLSLEDALHLVAYRAQLISELPAGEMIAVSLPEERIAGYLSAQVNLAAVNSPAACVLAGPGEQIARVSARLQQDGIAVRRVETTHAFHSSMLASLQERLTTFVGTLQLNEPGIPYISNVTGTWITAEQATDPAYWAQHMCQTVRFASGAGALLQEAEYLLLEVGPGQSLASFVKQHPTCTRERLPLIRATLPARADRGSEQAALCNVLGHLWLCGVAIDWHGFYAEERRLRLPLPTYPFERKRYWIATRHAADSLAGNLLASPETVMSRLKREPLADWFYAPGWRTAAPLPASAATPAQDAICWLLFLDAYGIGEHIAARLHERGEECILVQAGQGFAQLDEAHYMLRPAERADYTRLLNELGARGKRVQRIVHLWSLGEALGERALCYGFSSLFALAQALGDSEGEHCQLTVVSDATQNVTGDEPIAPIKATLIGPCFVLPQEYPRIQCRCIDIVVPAPGSRAYSALTRQLVSEITSTESERLVALRADRRWVPSFEAMHVESAADQPLPLRQGGVYLITGGLGGIGLAMAHFLAAEYQARLALVGRSGFPSRDQWQQLLEDQAGDERVKQRIQRIQELEALGAEVLVIQADVREKEPMRRAIAQVQQRFGTLHGVLHTAGVPGVGLTQFKTIEQAREVMGPKVEGTLVLEELLGDSDLELLVLFSSVTARMGGGPGQIDYSAANAFLGAFAQSWCREGRHTVAIDWGEWQWNAWEAGLTGYDTQIQTFLKENRRKFGIAFEEGSEALKRVLATGLSQVIVSTQNFPALVAESKRLTAAYAVEQGRALRQNQETHPRPELLDAYLPARNEKEQQIVALWEELLGIIPVGINDNFFELGGNSLIGIDLIARLRKMFQLEVLASHVLYEAPTISTMALYLEQGTSAQDAKQRLDRGEKRRESQTQRIRQLKGRGDQGEGTARIVVGSRARTRS